jgi:hypothetical protein
MSESDTSSEVVKKVADEEPTSMTEECRGIVRKKPKLQRFDTAIPDDIEVCRATADTVNTAAKKTEQWLLANYGNSDAFEYIIVDSGGVALTGWVTSAAEISYAN